MSDTDARAANTREEAIAHRDHEGESAEPFSGRSVRRREDDALLRGRASFTDDLHPRGMVYLRFVRSEHGHATLAGIDTTSARSMDGILGVYTWDDIDASTAPGILPINTGQLEHEVPGHPLLARERVRYHGQPIAAVIGTSPYRAQDGVDAVHVEYASRESVIDPRRARTGDAPVLYENVPDNVITRSTIGSLGATEQAFDRADRHVSCTLENNRLIPNALEPRVALAEYRAGTDELTVTLASQSVHGHRRKLAHTLGVDESDLRIIAPAVGGGFGHKGHHHPGEAMAAWCARELNNPVKWTATRRENYLEGAHGRDHHTTGEMALTAEGSILGLRVETTANAGAYGLGGSLGMPGWYGRLLSSQYDIPAIHCETVAVFTNTAPIHSYRGAGRPEAIYVTERLVDCAAGELGIDPVSLRRRNLITPDQFPYTTAVGATYDSGSYERALERCLGAIGYDELRSSGRNREDGRLRGIGVACYTESTGGGYESGIVRVHPDGSVDVYVGTHSHGQGHETTYAQLVADALDISMDRIDVIEGDSDQIPAGTGTFGSRSTIVGGNAIAQSAHQVRAKARRLAAHLLEVAPEDVRYTNETFTADGNGGSDRSIDFEEVAGAAHGWSVPDGMSPGLEATSFYEVEGTAYTFGTHAAEVAVDEQTGELEIMQYLAVDDCGERINPLLIDGQVHGGVAQGIGQARSERTVYDADGTLQTDTMLQYALPRAAQLPAIQTEATVTPSPINELGVKGIGEAGTIAAPPAIVNAVTDALRGHGITHVDMPVTDEAIWRAMRRDANRTSDL